MAWDLDNDRPIYAQLVEKLQLAVLTGRFPPGGRLPSVRELAAEAGVNPNTMQRALAQLEQQCLISTQRTAGRTVTEDKDLIAQIRLDLARERAAAFLQAMAVLGYTPEDLPALLETTWKEGTTNGDFRM